MRVILKPFSKDCKTGEKLPDDIYIIFDDWENEYILESIKDRKLYNVNKNRVLKVLKD